MKVIIAGGRDYHLASFDEEYLDSLGITEVITGAAPGADWDAILWAKDREIPFRGIPAQWRKIGDKSAGPIRNTKLAATLLSLGGTIAVILFPGRRGTVSMRRIAGQFGVKVIEPHGKRNEPQHGAEE